MKKLNRRDFLGGLGVGAAALALPFTRTLTARGADGVPKRFVTFFTANGTLANRWASGSGADFELGSILAPLAPFRDKLLLVRGLDMDCTREGPGAGHQKGIGGLLTGQPLNDGEFTGGNGDVISGWAAGQSIDQRIAEQVGGETRFGSLELGVTVRGSNNRHRLAYRGSDDPIPPENDPWAVYDRLFAGLSEDPAGLQRIRQERGSVIDLVRGDLSELNTRLGTAERRRLDAHLESLRDVELRLDNVAAMGAACENPMMPGRVDPLDRDNHPLMSQLQLDLLAMAFACDMTRVATVLYSGATSSQTFNWLGISESHHTLSHESDSNTSAQNDLEDINRWYAEQIGYFLGKLDSIPEGDGTMLDNTVVLWGSELAKGNNHSRRDMDFVIAGSGGGYLDTGRLVEFDGRQHNDLLVTIANACGVEIDRWGHSGYTEGPLTRLLA